MSKSADNKKYWDADQLEDLLDREKHLIEEARGRPPSHAIALSGGGIRSATFSLGALQALARFGILDRMDYLSTVSGGGYLGGSLQWWWNGPNEAEREFDASSAGFPYGTTDPQVEATGSSNGHASDDQKKILGYLRSHGNYLTPGRGIGIWSGVGILTRAIVLNLILWLTLATFLFWLLIGLSDMIHRWLGVDSLLGRMVDALTLAMPPLTDGNPGELPFIFAILLCVAGGIVILFLLFSIAYSLSTFMGRTAERVLHRREPADALKNLHSLSAKSSSKYGWRRIYETVYQSTHPVFYGLLAIGLIPVLHTYAIADKPGLQGLVMTGAGVASGLWGYFGSMRKFAPSLATRVGLPVGSLLFLYGGAILAYQMARFVLEPGNDVASLEDREALVELIFVGLVILAFALMLIVNINYISPHRFYRDRIMEAFMPAWSTVATNSTGWSPLADRFRMSRAWPLKPGSAKTPFPIINTNVVLVNEQPRKHHDDIPRNERHRRFRMRGGDNFILTPFTCGSLATGWRESEAYMGDNVTVASAVAISGAAANPNAAYLGSGHTRNRFVSVVMRLFNLRLGYWVANPRFDKGEACRANHFRPGLWYSITSRGHKSKRPIVELTDGGHFDNLGVYELIRRRAKLIIVCDGEADKETSYSAFVSLVRRIEQDFSARIEFKDGRGPELLVEDIPMLYPSGAKRATRGFFAARIRYDEQTEPGIIIYLKATMIDEVSLKTKGYKGAHPDFPDETTADQFFDDEQFEAYRELGYAIAMSAVHDLKLSPDSLEDPVGLLDNAWHDEELVKASIGEEA